MIDTLPGRIGRENPSLLGRLAALNLDLAIRGYDNEQIAAVLRLLANLQSLRCLSMRICRLQDEGLVRLAPFISRLTKLDVYGNRATHLGITAVLEAAARAAAAGAEGLRELDISENHVDLRAAAEVAAVLRLVTSLEVLNLRSIFKWGGGLQELVPAVKALPRLSRLRLPDTRGARHHADTSDAADAPLLAGLRHVKID